MNKISINHHLFQLIIAHAKEITREPAVLFWGIIFPILMALGLGIAFTKKPDVIRTIVVVKDDSAGNYKSSLSRLHHYFNRKDLNLIANDQEYILQIDNDQLGNMTYIFKESSWDEAMILLKRGQINLILEHKGDQLHYHFDPLNPEAQLLYLQLSQIQAGKGIQSTGTRRSN